MSPGRRQAGLKSMWLIYDQLPQSQGHVFYERLQKHVLGRWLSIMACKLFKVDQYY